MTRARHLLRWLTTGARIKQQELVYPRNTFTLREYRQSSLQHWL